MKLIESGRVKLEKNRLKSLAFDFPSWFPSWPFEDPKGQSKTTERQYANLAENFTKTADNPSRLLALKRIEIRYATTIPTNSR